MRRPRALPQTTAENDAPPARPKRERSKRADAAADVAALRSPTSRAAEPRAVSDDAEAAAAEAAAEVTVRDVWRAARARRKALRSEIRRFTQESRRRRWWRLGILGGIVLVIGGTIGAAYSPLFAVQTISVVGTSRLDAATVEAALAGEIGTPLALVSSDDVQGALAEFPGIESYAIEANPPHGLTVRIVERTPVGVLASSGGFDLVDAAGVVLSSSPEQPAGEPVLSVTGGVGSDAFESVGLVVRSLPADVRARVTAVSATTLDDVTLTLDSGATVVWGSADDSRDKALALSALMVAQPEAQSFDVSSPNVVVAG